MPKCPNNNGHCGQTQFTQKCDCPIMLNEYKKFHTHMDMDIDRSKYRQYSIDYCVRGPIHLLLTMI